MMRVMDLISRREAKFWLMVLLSVGSFGCTHSFSPIVLDTVEKHLTFEVVIQNPKAYVGSVVLWGGVIEKTFQASGGTKLIVIQTPLDSKGNPKTDITEGEFVAQTLQPLDPKVYRKGVKVTLAGEITGAEERQGGPMEYPRPVIAVIEIRPWEQRVWGVFPLTRGWKVDQYSPLPSPFAPPHAP